MTKTNVSLLQPCLAIPRFLDMSTQVSVKDLSVHPLSFYAVDFIVVKWQFLLILSQFLHCPTSIPCVSFCFLHIYILCVNISVILTRPCASQLRARPIPYEFCIL